MNTNFTLAQISKEASTLLKDAKHILSNSHNIEIKSQANKVPEALTSGDSKLNIVFAGAYSAGKSTLLSLLTEIPLKTGGGIVTDSCRTLDWNGINVVDTPGIHTELYKDHDAKTYEALSHADLVVFVTTQKGFNTHLANHFRKLAVDRHKGSEMMLVINKMDEIGLTPQNCDITFKGNFAKALVPFTRKGLYTTFMSTRRWQQAKQTTENKKKEQFLLRSGRDEFINNIEDFIKDKRLNAKLTTNLFILEHLLTEIIAKYKTNDNTIDGMKEMLIRQRNILIDSRHNITDKSNLIISQQKSLIQEWGNEIASSITSSTKQEELESLVKDRMRRVDDAYTQAVTQFEQIVAEEDEKVTDKFKTLVNSQFGKQVYNLVELNISELKVSADMMRKVESNAKKLNDFAKTLIGMSKGPNASGGWSNFFKIGQASQSQMHKAVLNVGHFFGHKFQPWGAVKIAARIGQGAKVLGVIGSVLGVVAQIWCDKNDESVEKTLMDARNDIRGVFGQAANVVEMEFDKNTQQWVMAKYDPAIKEVDKQIDELTSVNMQKNKEYMALKDLQTRCRSLIDKIQANL